MSTDSFDLGGEGAGSFPFERPGDSVTGQVIDMVQVQQTDINTNEPVFWTNGQAKMQYRVKLQTELRDDAADDGVRAVYLSGSRKPETMSKLAVVLEAVRKVTGGTQLTPGAWLTLTYVSDGQRTKPGFNPPKQYSSVYRQGGGDLAPPAQSATSRGAQTPGAPPF